MSVSHVGGLTLAVLAFLLALLHSPWRDSGVYLYVAQRFLDGALPYLDTWDHKPPLIYWINAAGLYLANGSYLGVTAIEVASFAGAVVLAFKTLAMVLDKNSAFVGTAALCVGVLQTISGGNLAPEFALPAQLAAIFLVFSKPFSQLSARRMLVVGFLAAIAAMLKPNLIGVWIALNAVMLLDVEPRRYLVRLLLQACGAILGIVLITAPIWLRGGAEAMRVAVLDYNFHYSAANGIADRVNAAIGAFGAQSLLGMSCGLGAAILAYVWARWADLKQENPRLLAFSLFAILLLVVELAFATTSGRSYAHYYLPLSLPIALLFGLAAHLLTSGPARENSFARLLSGGLVLGILLSGTPALLASAYTARAFAAGRPTSQEEAAAYVAARTSQADPVLVWGAESTINFLSRRPAPTPLVYQYPLVTQGVASEDLAAKFAADLAGRPPAFIIDTFNPHLPPIDPALRSTWQPSTQERYGLPPKSLELFYAMVAQQYERVGKLGGYDFYRRRNHP